jgi:hypothetical protein
MRLREPDAPPPASADTLTYEQVTEVFDRTPAIHEPERSV